MVGCLFGNLSTEVSGQDEIVRARLQEIFTEQIDLVEHVVREIIADTGSDARNTARSIVAQLEGLVIFAKLFNDASHVDALWQHSSKLLGIPTPISSRVPERSAA